MRIRTLLISSVFVATAAGCSAGARVVRTGMNGGVLAMHGPMMSAAHHGRQALVEHCGGSYVVSRRGEALGLANGHATLAEDSVHRTPEAAVGSGDRVIRFRCQATAALASR